MFLSRKISTRKAFTLLELIVVIVILGILAALAIPTFKTVIDRSSDGTTITSLESLSREAQALMAFQDGTTWDEAMESAAADTSSAAGVGVYAAGTLTALAGELPTPGDRAVVAYQVSTDQSHVVAARYSDTGDLCFTLFNSSTMVESGCGDVDAAAVTPAAAAGGTLAESASVLASFSSGGGDGGVVVDPLAHLGDPTVTKTFTYEPGKSIMVRFQGATVPDDVPDMPGVPAGYGPDTDYGFDRPTYFDAVFYDANGVVVDTRQGSFSHDLDYAPDENEPYLAPFDSPGRGCNLVGTPSNPDGAGGSYCVTSITDTSVPFAGGDVVRVAIFLSAFNSNDNTTPRFLKADGTPYLVPGVEVLQY